MDVGQGMIQFSSCLLDTCGHPLFLSSPYQIRLGQCVIVLLTVGQFGLNPFQLPLESLRLPVASWTTLASERGLN